MKLKKRKCKECGEVFQKLRPLQSVCGYECSKVNAKKQTKKKKDKKLKEINKDVRERKEKLKTNSDWLRDTQKVVNKYIRERDKNELNCISCGKFINGVRHASHYMSSGGHSNIRFNTDNIWVSCYKCNVMLSGNQLPYRVRLIEKIGLKRVEYIESIAHDTKRYSIDELKDIMIVFKLKIKELNK